MLKNTVNRPAAGIGYGFLAGGAVGLLVGVLTNHLFLSIVVGASLGAILGWLFSLIVTR